jgi:hypothetical protein
MSRTPAWVRRINSHERFTHDSIDSLGYDWSRVAEPAAAPRFPLRVYLPQTTDDVVEVLAEAKALGHEVTVRAHGHSSNDLVVRDRGTVLLTEKLDRVLEIDEQAMTVTVQAGSQSADVDEALAARGLGLPVIGDHAHVTTGGFASVGGISASSFRHGLFVDLVTEIEYVKWDGEVRRASRTHDAAELNQVLLGLGRYGVITSLTVRVERVDKHATIWRNRQSFYRSLDAFLAAAGALLADPPPEARFLRGMWVDAGRLAIGQFSVYVPAEPTPVARLADKAAYGALNGIGYVAGRLPPAIDRALKYVGLAGIVFAPPFAAQKNAESFSDRVIDSTVGDPTRYLVAIVRQRDLDAVARRLHDLLARYRDDTGCFTVITLYLKGIRSAHLAAGRPGDDQWVEVLFFVAMAPDRMTPALLERIVEDFDEICDHTGSLRYMHSRTTRDPDRRRRLDPHTLCSTAGEEVPDA